MSDLWSKEPPSEAGDYYWRCDGWSTIVTLKPQPLGDLWCPLTRRALSDYEGGEWLRIPSPEILLKRDRVVEAGRVIAPWVSASMTPDPANGHLPGAEYLGDAEAFLSAVVELESAERGEGKP